MPPNDTELNLHVQVATAADFPAIEAVVNAAYRGVGAQPGWTSEVELFDGPRVQPEALRLELAGKPGAHILVLRRGTAPDVLGCVLLEPADPGTWYLGMLSIRPDLQDQGAGRLLLGAAERRAGAHGIGRIRITVVDARESLLAWYRRRGYVPTGDADFPYDDPSVGRPTRADLRFVVLEKEVMTT